MEYCCHVWAGAPSCYLELLDKLKNEYAGLLVLQLLLLLNSWLIVEMWQAKVFSIGITLVDVLQNWLNWSHVLFLEGDLLIIMIDRMIFLSPFLDVTTMSVYVKSFFSRTARLCNSLPIECFPLTYDPRGFKSRINRHLLTAGSL